MPFTFAHPAAIIPLYKKAPAYFSLTGLIVGSIIPDFEYFLNFSSRSVISHTWHGVFIFDLPAAFVLAVLFHFSVKQTLLPNLPQKYFSHFVPVIYSDWFSYFRKKFPVFFVSAFIGIITHNAWDSVSHMTGYFVERTNFLNRFIFFRGITLYRIFWHISTWLGSWYVWNYFRKKNFTFEKANSKTVPAPSKHYWPIVFLFSCIMLSIEWIPFLYPTRLRDLFIATLGSTLFSIIIASFFFRNQINLSTIND